MNNNFLLPIQQNATLMSVYQFLKSVTSESYQEPADSREPEGADSVLEGGSTFFYLVLLLVAIVFYCFYCVFLYFFSKPERANTIAFNLVFNLQNYFNNPTIHHIHFHHGDQVVPNSDEM